MISIDQDNNKLEKLIKLADTDISIAELRLRAIMVCISDRGYKKVKGCITPVGAFVGAEKSFHFSHLKRPERSYDIEYNLNEKKSIKHIRIPEVREKDVIKVKLNYNDGELSTDIKTKFKDVNSETYSAVLKQANDVYEEVRFDLSDIEKEIQIILGLDRYEFKEYFSKRSV